MTVYVTFVFSFDVSAHFDFRLQQLWTASTYTSRSVILRNRSPAQFQPARKGTECAEQNDIRPAPGSKLQPVETIYRN